MAAAGNEAHQRATHRLGDRLIVHGEGMMRVRLGRETCQAEPRERDQPTDVSSALCHRVLLCSLVVALNQPAIQRGHHALAGDDTGLSGLFAQLPITVDNRNGWGDGDWNRKVDDIDRVIDRFRDWRYEWLDVPAMLRGADEMFEYPMIDRDPVPTWVDGHVALLGDAAHVMYPTGSNGASQAVMDARVLGAALLEHGVTPRALQAYDAQLCGEISAVVLRNRGAGPFGLLNLLDERCGGVFDDIDAVIPPAERDEFMSRYKAAAGFAKDKLNGAPSIIPPGARVRRA